MQLIARIGKMFDRPAAQEPRVYREERTSPRCPTTLRAAFDGGSFMLERQGNVSIGGFCFESEGALPVGSKVRLLIHLEGKKHWVRASGEVLGHVKRRGQVYVRGHFTRIHLEDELQLARWLDQQNLASRAA